VGTCTNACPADLDISHFLDQIELGNRRAALAIVRKALPLPAVLGQVCAGFCESACLRKNVDEAVSVRTMHGLLAEADMASADPYIPPRAPSTGKRVAIVGAGPSGLSAAHYLLERGHACIVFEANERAGGLLRYGMPPDMLDKAVVDAEVEIIVRMGAELRLGWRLGTDGTLDELRAEYDAVLLALGAQTRWTSESRAVDAAFVRSLGVIAGPTGVSIERATGATSLGGVFAAGEVVSGVSNTVRSIASGHRAADAIAAMLEYGAPHARKPWFFRSKMTEQETAAHYAQPPAPRASRISLGVAFEKGLGPSAQSEASRCLDCACPSLDSCALRAYSARYNADPNRYLGARRRELQVDRSHPIVDYEPGKCILCGLCIAVAEAAGDTLAFTGRGFETRVTAPFEDEVRRGIATSARRCAEVCPSGAITLKLGVSARDEAADHDDERRPGHG
jgi:ferredoxin